MTSRLTINVKLQYVKDWGKTLTFLRALDPVAVVAVIDTMSAKPRLLELRAALPNAKIIARHVIIVTDNGQQKELDGAMHTKPQDSRYYLVSPGDFLNTWQELGKDGLSLSYFNEPLVNKASPDDIARQVQHMIETIGLATSRGVSLVVGNWGAGHYLDARFDDVFEIVGKQSSLHSLGLHAYSPIDTFNCLDAVIGRCKARGLVIPRMHITEFGFDSGNPDDPLNGYKSRGISGEQFAAWAVDKVKNVYSPYIRENNLESVAVFGWGYDDAKFRAFDVETDTAWQTAILDASQKGVLSVPSKPVTKPFLTPVPKPDTATDAIRIRVTNASGINVRSGNGTEYQLSRTLEKGSEVTLYRSPFKTDGSGQTWRWVDVSATEGGWLSFDALQFSEVKPEPVPSTTTPPTPPVVIQLPPVTPELAYTMTASERKLLYEQIAVMQNAMLTIVNLVGGLQETTKLSNAA